MLAALEPVIDALEALGVEYSICGSVASSAHGVARSTVDADLVAHNTKLSPTLLFGSKGEPTILTVTLVVEKIAPRGKRPATMLPTFCPFCGHRYRPEPAAEA